MGIFKSIVTVELRKSIKGVVVGGWREHGKSKRNDIKYIPWSVAAYLNLMPRGVNFGDFSNTLYDFSCKDLDELEANGKDMLKVTRKRGRVFLTIDMSKV